MELSKNETIFSILENQIKSLDDNTIINIKITNDKSSWTETEFNNFRNVMKSLKYKEEIENDYIEAVNDDNVLKINGMSNIIKYCYNDDYKVLDYEWLKYNEFEINEINDLFDVNLKIFNTTSASSVEPHNWDEIKKYFRIIKKFNYITDDGIIYTTKLIKETPNEMYDTLKQSCVISSYQNYEFEIKFPPSTSPKSLNKEKILGAIIKIQQAILLSNILLTKNQQKNILAEYFKLIKDDIKTYRNNNEVILLAPKPITLERINLINPNEYGACSILSGYTVTDKADGERLLLYINNNGNVYIINSSYHVEDTGIIGNKNIHNTLIDGEYISCIKRKDIFKNNIYAAFDIYYLNGKKVTDLPLIDSDKKGGRYNLLKSIEKDFNNKNSSIDFMVKVHHYNEDILKDCDKILNDSKSYPYEIDGLIFTPAKLAVFSYYPTKIATITENMKWDRVFKWKPEDQNTIDFLIRENKNIVIDGLKYKELYLYVGYNKSQWEEINPEKGLRLRYDYEYNKLNRVNNTYEAILFKPDIDYHNNVYKCYVKININGDYRAENGDKIENNSIVEFRYILDEKKWVPIRVRNDKTKIYKKGILSKTANDYSVAINIWRSIHKPVYQSMITGNRPIYSKEAPDNINERLLDTNDIYYSREIPRDSLLSVHMLNFHNQGIKKELYLKPTNKGSLLELACGEGGDMNRWIDAGYNFILGVDLVRNNIYNPKSGAYSRMLKRKNNYKKIEGTEKVFYANMVFVVGDCAKNIKNGETSKSVNDIESQRILRVVMNKNKTVEPYYRHIAGKGFYGFDAVSCMFAIHYFFENEEKLNGFLTNVSQNLKKGGTFFCTFMDGNSVKKAIDENGGDMIEGKKHLGDDKIPVWAVIRRYNNDDEDDILYNKKVDIYIENTQKLIPEYLVNFNLLVEKAKEYNLEINESEMFSETFNKIKSNIPSDESARLNLHDDILKLDDDEIQKKFSFLNRWATFKKV